MDKINQYKNAAQAALNRLKSAGVSTISLQENLNSNAAQATQRVQSAAQAQVKAQAQRVTQQRRLGTRAAREAAAQARKQALIRELQKIEKMIQESRTKINTFTLEDSFVERTGWFTLTGWQTKKVAFIKLVNQLEKDKGELKYNQKAMQQLIKKINKITNGMIVAFRAINPETYQELAKTLPADLQIKQLYPLYSNLITKHLITPLVLYQEQNKDDENQQIQGYINEILDPLNMLENLAREREPKLYG